MPMFFVEKITEAFAVISVLPVSITLNFQFQDGIEIIELPEVTEYLPYFFWFLVLVY